MTIMFDIGKHDIGIKKGKIEYGNFILGIYFIFFQIVFYNGNFLHYAAILKSKIPEEVIIPDVSKMRIDKNEE